jgi:hypothetical protein
MPESKNKNISVAATSIKISDLPPGGQMIAGQQFESNKSFVSVSQTAADIKSYVDTESIFSLPAGSTALAAENANAVNRSTAVASTVLVIESIEGFPVGTTFDLIREGPGPASVSGEAGVSVNGVDGGSLDIGAQYGRLTAVKLELPHVWSVEGFNAAGVTDLQNAYADGGGQIDTVAGKPFRLNSTTSAFGVPQMTDAQFLAVTTPFDGMKAWATDTSREVHRVSGAKKEVAYLDDIPAITNTPNRVIFSNASGDFDTSVDLTFESTSGILEGEIIKTNTLLMESGGRLLYSQNAVNADRAMDPTDAGLILNAATPAGSILNLPPAGDIAIDSFASFFMFQKDANPLFVKAPVGVTIDGVDGATIQTTGVGSFSRLIRDANAPDNWYRIGEGVEDDLQSAYDSGNGQIDTIADKPFRLNSTTSAFGAPQMTQAEFAAVSSPFDGMKAWASDVDREVHRVSGIQQEVAYLSDIAALEEDVVYGESHFQGNATETVISTQGVPVKIAGTYVTGELSGFTHAAGTLTYVVTAARTIAVQACITCSLNLASSSVTILIAKNGTVLPKSAQTFDLDGPSPSFKALTSLVLVPLVATDTLEVFIQNNSGTDNITVQDLSFVPHSMGGSSTEGDVVSTWDGSTAPVDVTAGTNVSITGGAISVPDYSADESDIVFHSTSGLANFTNLSSFIVRSGLVVHVKKNIQVQLSIGPAWVEYEVPFITSFSSPMNINEVCGDATFILSNNPAAVPTLGFLFSAEPVPGTNRIRFTVNNTAWPEQLFLRLDFMYRAEPIPI